jgi:transposase
MLLASSKAEFDGKSFHIYDEKVVLPTLRPDDIVTWTISAATTQDYQSPRSVGAKLILLPNYSPDLNLIEQVFAKLKRPLRKAAARTIEAVSAATASSSEPSRFKNTGYAPR